MEKKCGRKKGSKEVEKMIKNREKRDKIIQRGRKKKQDGEKREKTRQTRGRRGGKN